MARNSTHKFITIDISLEHPNKKWYENLLYFIWIRIKQGWKRSLDKENDREKREKEREKGRRRDIEREGEIRERDVRDRERDVRDREWKGGA